MEKAGSITNSGRWVQWREAVVPPHHGVRSDLWLLDRLCRELKRQYGSGGAFPAPVVELAWDCGSPEPDPERVAQEINGRFLANVDDAATGGRFRAGEAGVTSIVAESPSPPNTTKAPMPRATTARTATTRTSGLRW